MGEAAVSWPKGHGFDSHLTGFAGHASEHGCGDLNRGSSSLDTLVMRSGAISLEAVDTRLSSHPNSFFFFFFFF